MKIGRSPVFFHLALVLFLTVSADHPDTYYQDIDREYAEFVASENGEFTFTSRKHLAHRDFTVEPRVGTAVANG